MATAGVKETTIKSVNPATGELIREYPDTSEQDAIARLEGAAKAFSSWRRTTFAERAERMRRAAELLRQDRELLARLATEEMGKPIAAAEAEIDKCAWVCEFYAEHAERLLAERDVPSEAARSYVRYEPLGVILAIMPWNFPYWQVFRFAAPALMAGNVAVLKHASNVSGVALAIEQVLQQAGFPELVFSVLLVAGSRATQLIGHPAVRGVTVTGSDRVGKAVAAEAGRWVKKTVLELGGSDPFIVLGDAHVAEAVILAVEARMVNAGQSCIAAKRFLVDETLAGRFEEALVAHFEQLRVGDPMDRNTDIGPLAREDLLDALHTQVERSRLLGAAVRTGGKRLPQPGYFYAPTVLGQVEPGMPAFDEETFGPVAAITPFGNPQEAIELANQSRYGLGATIVTQDLLLAQDMAKEIESGMVFVNRPVASDPRVPFGGVKDSGYGRELGVEGIREFTNIKTVWVAQPA
jgi:succinate-semialdehyde dehydrogenase/glutarate-semialdehyde dehydrogenase